MNFIYTRISEQPERLISSRKKKKRKELSIYIQKINLFKYIKMYLHI